MEYPGTKRCGSCKHFEPSTEWRRGWCRNTLLFAPSQSHLVDSEGLDCSRGALDFWEPNPEIAADSQQNAGQQHVKLPNFPNPLKSFAPAPAGPALATAGANGGHMMFASSGGSGGGGYDDDDYGFDDDYAYEDDPEPAPERPANKRSSQARSKSGSAAGSGRSRSASYQSEERYWTDYLRIALPVIGIVLMLGLLWIWASHLLGGPSDDGDITSTDTVGLVTTTTPEPTEVSTPSTNAGEIPIGNTQPTQPPVAPTPTNTPTSGDNQTDGTETEEETPEAPTNIEPDAYVLITEDEVNMRKTPSTSGDVVRQVRRGELFQVRSGPEDADGYTWWEVVSDEEGDSGYIVENFLELTD